MSALELVLAALAVQAAEPSERPVPACVGWNVVMFESGSAALSPQASSILDNFAELLRQSAIPSRVRLTGHADRLGSAAANLRLSRRRAAAMAEFLVGRGVPLRLIAVTADGEERPLVETADGIPEAQNRNVVVEEIVDPAEMARREAVWARTGRPRIVC